MCVCVRMRVHLLVESLHPTPAARANTSHVHAHAHANTHKGVCGMHSCVVLVHSHTPCADIHAHIHAHTHIHTRMYTNVHTYTNKLARAGVQSRVMDHNFPLASNQQQQAGPHSDNDTAGQAGTWHVYACTAVIVRSTYKG